MGIVQGLTEFLPISSAGHLILVPWLFGWDDRFVTSLAFSVMLHLGTLGALLLYFARDWIRLVGAGVGSLRERRIGDDPTRRLAWVLVVATVPAALAGALLGDAVEANTRRPAIVAAGRLLGLEREAAARFSFLLATPTIAGAGLFELYRLARGESSVSPDLAVLVVGIVASAVTGVLAIHGLLGWFKRRGVGIFVLYRVALAAAIVILLLQV